MAAKVTKLVASLHDIEMLAMAVKSDAAASCKVSSKATDCRQDLACIAGVMHLWRVPKQAAGSCLSRHSSRDTHSQHVQTSVRKLISLRVGHADGKEDAGKTQGHSGSSSLMLPSPHHRSTMRG